MILFFIVKDRLAIIISGGGMKCGWGAGIIGGLAQRRKILGIEMKTPFVIIGASGSAPTAVCDTTNQHEMLLSIWKNNLSTKEIINGFKIHINHLVDEVIRKKGFDLDSFYKSETNCLIPAIDINKGEIEYFSNKDKYFLDYFHRDEIFEVVKASMTMPVFSRLKPVKVRDSIYCDSILTSSAQTHLEKVIEMGANKVLIIDHDPKKNKLVDPEKLSFNYWSKLQSDEFQNNYHELEEKVKNYILPRDVEILKLDIPEWLSVTTLNNDKKVLRESVDYGVIRACYNKKVFSFLKN